MDVDQFYSWVRDTLNRGTTLDNVIPHYIRAAVREIENKTDWSRLEWWASFTLGPGDEPVFDTPTELKQIKFIRYNNETDSSKRPEWMYLYQGAPQAQVSRLSDHPKKYWLVGRDHIVLDAKMDSETRNFEILALRYSSVPDEADGSGVNHWLIDMIPMGLHAKVMLGLAGYMREDDPRMFQNWQQLYTEAIRSLFTDDAWLKEAGASAEMEYWPDHVPYEKAWRDNG